MGAGSALAGVAHAGDGEAAISTQPEHSKTLG